MKLLKYWFRALTLTIKMLARTRPLVQRASLIRFNSTKPRQPLQSKQPGEQPEISNRDRVQFASSSIKDIFDGFLTTEESFDPIDTKPILAEPSKFNALSQFHRNQVVEEVEKRLKRNWNAVPEDSKRMAYYISYGPWGVREDLDDSCFANVIPQDLPFEIPSKLSKINPSPTDVIKKLKDVDLMQVSEERRKEFKKYTRTLDPLSKFIVYFAAVISLIALYRDKYIGEDHVEDYESPLWIAEKNRQLELEAREAEEKARLEEEIRRKQSKKWYYLWLK